MTIKPNNRAALDFLRQWEPEGPWVLTAIQTDRKKIATATFDGTSISALGSWLTKYNGERNIYFHVNSTTKPMTVKANREHIKSLDWLHIDIDPRVGEDLEDARIRSLGLLRENLPEGVPPPTVIIFSGGGYQGFWKLEEPVVIDGDLPKAEDAKRWNQQLEVLFDGDNCHNIDRIMRLPGTVNLPDARKLKKGRVPVLAELVSFKPELVYPLTDFTPAQAVQMDEPGGFSGAPHVEVGGDVEYFDDVNELDKWDVPDRVKIAIVQGKHPEEPKQGDNSRSSWLFDVCCNLLRCGVPDEVVYSVVTNKVFGIAESVLEAGANAQKYALRQISRAKEEIEEPWLRRLNERHAVIENLGGKCLVVEKVHDPVLNRHQLTMMSLEMLTKIYENQQIEVGTDAKGAPRTMEVGKYWRKHPMRRQYRSLVFAPGKDTPSAYNLWEGFAVQAIKGKCELFLNHTRDNICNGDEETFNYLIRWMARAVQDPGSQGEVAVVMRGGRGTGKSVWAKVFGSLFGVHFVPVSNPSHLVGNFNNHLRNTVVLFADEAFYAGDKKHASVLKTLITEDTITIEAKGIDIETVPNFVHLIMASNDPHVIPAGGDERRFLVLDVGKDHQRDSSYFKALIDQMDAGGREALLFYLMNLDLDGFQVRDVPETDALREQKLLSLNVEEEWWFQKLESGDLLRLSTGWEPKVIKDKLVDDYVHYTRRFNISHRGNQTSLGKFLQRVYPDLGMGRAKMKWEEQMGDGFTKTINKVVPVYVLPKLEAARAQWCELYGEQDWLDPEPTLDLDDPGEEVPF